MKIESVNSAIIHPISLLMPGDCFSYNHDLYIKVNSPRGKDGDNIAVNLENGAETTFNSWVEVKVEKAKILLEK